MSGFENYERQLAELEHEIAVRLQVLHIDIHNEAALRLLAREAMHCPQQCPEGASVEERAKADLFGFAALMLKTMSESADHGEELHGGPVWKAFGKALWEASGSKDDRL